MAAKRQKAPQTLQQLQQDERHYRAVSAAQAGVAKRGGKAMNAMLNGRRWARYEKQVDEMFPGLRERDPNDFASRVQALNASHMAKVTAASIAARVQAKAKCPWCRASSGDSWRERPGDDLCAQHQRTVERHNTRRGKQQSAQTYAQSA